MSVKKSKRPVKKGARAANRTGGHRRAKFQPWRTSNGRIAPVVVKKLDELDRDPD